MSSQPTLEPDVYRVRQSISSQKLYMIESIEPVNFIITRIYNPDADADTIQALSNKIAIFHRKNFLITTFS